MRGPTVPADEPHAIVPAAESRLTQFKRSASDANALCRTICAFANDLAVSDWAGSIFVGLNDDGSCAGLVITEKLLRKLADLRDNGNIQPIPSLAMESRTIGECPVAGVGFQPSPYIRGHTML